MPIFGHAVTHLQTSQGWSTDTHKEEQPENKLPPCPQGGGIKHYLQCHLRLHEALGLDIHETVFLVIRQRTIHAHTLYIMSRHL